MLHVVDIPRPEKILEYKDTPGIKTFYQQLYFYYLNYLTVEHPEPNAVYKDYKPWQGSVMGTYNYSKKSPEDVRTYRNRKDQEHTMVMDGSWHYSFMGGTEMIIKKLKTYPHTEYMGPKTFDPLWIEEQVRLEKDILNKNMTFKRILLDERAPKYLADNQELYQHLILPG